MLELEVVAPPGGNVITNTIVYCLIVIQVNYTIYLQDLLTLLSSYYNTQLIILEENTELCTIFLF